jgi:hypothetical protein
VNIQLVAIRAEMVAHPSGVAAARRVVMFREEIQLSEQMEAAAVLLTHPVFRECQAVTV